jgi:predicted GIY-YIG superfamily endonuclease|tara:strand:- start:192 stop:347 length:156 start_codon:yes stop_codon:yes gene_type:complete
MSIKWEVTIMEMHDNGKRFKVTRRMHEMNVSETKVFDTKEDAMKQFNEWLE